MEIDFYYGIGSRYSYLASTQLDALVRDTGCHLVWKPLYSGLLIERQGGSPFKGTPVSGQYDWAYRESDAKRWADLYGVPFVEPRQALKEDRALLTRLALACTAAASLGAAEAFSRRLFNAIFVQAEGDLGEAALTRMAVASGLAEADFATALRASSTMAALEATTREAGDRGAFGVPSFFVGEALFWGNDRLVLLRHHLLHTRAHAKAARGRGRSSIIS